MFTLRNWLWSVRCEWGIRSRPGGRLNAWSPILSSRSVRRHGPDGGIVRLARGHHRIGNPRHLVGHGHDGDVGVAARLQRLGPATGAVLFVLERAQDSAGAVDEQVAQVDIAALADAKQAIAPASGMLTRHQSDPRSEPAAIAEQGRILADGGEQGGGTLGADAGDRHQVACLAVAVGDGIDLRVIVGHAFVEVTQLLGKAVQLGAEAWAQAVVSILQDLRQAPLHGRAPLRDLDAVLQQQAANLVDLRGTPIHGQAAHAMDGLDVLLRDRLDGDEAHVRALCGLADRLGIGRVVLVRLHERLDELRRDQAYLVPIGAEQPRPVVRAPARLHRDRAGRQIGNEFAQTRPGQLLAQHLPPVAIDAKQVEAALGQIDTQHLDGVRPRHDVVSRSML